MVVFPVPGRPPRMMSIVSSQYILGPITPSIKLSFVDLESEGSGFEPLGWDLWTANSRTYVFARMA
jgi:hypothetical protein